MTTILYLIVCYGGAAMELEGPFQTQCERLARAREIWYAAEVSLAALDLDPDHGLLLREWYVEQVDAEAAGMPETEEDCAPRVS